MPSRDRVVGFEAYETQGLMIMSYDFKGRTQEQAQRLVDEGKARWVLAPGAVLTLDLLEAPSV